MQELQSRGYISSTEMLRLVCVRVCVCVCVCVGKELKEATHINSGLLALGNVISALSSNAESSKRSHIPYR